RSMRASTCTDGSTDPPTSRRRSSSASSRAETGSAYRYGQSCGCDLHGTVKRETGVSYPNVFYLNTASLAMMGRGAPPSGPAVLELGATAAALPIPGSPCSLLVQPVVGIPLLSSSAGAVTWTLPLPITLIGDLRGQLFAVQGQTLVASQA